MLLGCHKADHVEPVNPPIEFPEYFGPDDSHSGHGSSIAIDAQNTRHISYFNYKEGSIKYAFFKYGIGMKKYEGAIIDSTAYNIVNIPATVIFNSIAVDKMEFAHVSYSRCFEDNVQHVDNDLYYATNSSGKWQSTLVDKEGNSGGYNSIGIDSKGKIHIAYSEYPYNLKYATNINGNWETTIIDPIQVIHCHIGIDSNDKLHISYMDHSSLNLKYATNINGYWETIVLDSLSGWDNDLAIDSHDKIHISHFTEIPTFALKYTTNVDGSWLTSIVEEDIDWGTSIKVDINDNVFISCFDNITHNLKVLAHFKSDVYWISKNVNEPKLDDIGRYDELALDMDQNLWITCCDWYMNKLKLFYVNQQDFKN